MFYFINPCLNFEFFLLRESRSFFFDGSFIQRSRREKNSKSKTIMKKSESSNVKDRVEESEEERFDNHCSFLRTHNREKLIQVTCNYFSLGQAELARATLRESRGGLYSHLEFDHLRGSSIEMDCLTDDTIISSSEMVLYEPSKRVRRIFEGRNVVAFRGNSVRYSYGMLTS